MLGEFVTYYGYEIYLTCMLIELYNNNNFIDWFMLMLLLTAHTNQIQSESLLLMGGNFNVNSMRLQIQVSSRVTNI